jgi:hypothetical protein
MYVKKSGNLFYYYYFRTSKTFQWFISICFIFDWQIYSDVLIIFNCSMVGTETACAWLIALSELGLLLDKQSGDPGISVYVYLYVYL